MSHISDFKKKYTLEERLQETKRIREKYPDRIPIIIEKSANSTVPDINKNKYLVPKEITIGQFIYIIRKRIELSQDKAIFLFLNDNIPATSNVLEQLYEEYKDEDNFIYFTYAGEATFG